MTEEEQERVKPTTNLATDLLHDKTWWEWSENLEPKQGWEVLLEFTPAATAAHYCSINIAVRE